MPNEVSHKRGFCVGVGYTSLSLFLSLSQKYFNLSIFESMTEEAGSGDKENAKQRVIGIGKGTDGIPLQVNFFAYWIFTGLIQLLNKGG